MGDIFERYRSCFLPSTVPAHIFTEITGVAPLYHLAVSQLVTRTAVVGIPAIDALHPAGQRPAVKFV